MGADAPLARPCGQVRSQAGIDAAKPARAAQARVDVPAEARDFLAAVRRVADAGRLREEARYVQHGSTSTLLHSIAVAWEADRLARSFGLDSQLGEIRRAALLHDYYLYDWHLPDASHRLHGFRHPGHAAINALRDYPDLTIRELDAIACHMFPLTPVPPHHRAGWIVTMADKRCASYETRMRHGAAYPQIRQWCAAELPDLELGPLSGPSEQHGEKRLCRAIPAIRRMARRLAGA